ncbi:cell division protein FtsK, partial [Salinisphaera sp. USBA-960]|nr:cell division protein FtsK [Salifodinibacter halophilus]
LGQLVGRSLYSGFGPVGGNLFLAALLLISFTLATSVSWFAVMDWIGKRVLTSGPLLSKLFRRSSQQATEWRQTQVMREEREE